VRQPPVDGAEVEAARLGPRGALRLHRRGLQTCRKGGEGSGVMHQASLPQHLHSTIDSKKGFEPTCSIGGRSLPPLLALRISVACNNRAPILRLSQTLQ
jgi:hypothetical protein